MLVDINVEIACHSGWGGGIFLTELMYLVHLLLERIQLISATTCHVYIYNSNVVVEHKVL